jgi:hypothetical protein
MPLWLNHTGRISYRIRMDKGHCAEFLKVIANFEISRTVALQQDSEQPRWETLHQQKALSVETFVLVLPTHLNRKAVWAPFSPLVIRDNRSGSQNGAGDRHDLPEHPHRPCSVSPTKVREMLAQYRPRVLGCAYVENEWGESAPSKMDKVNPSLDPQRCRLSKDYPVDT